jgi:hypothetical protein
VTLYSALANALVAFDTAMGNLGVQSNVTAFTESDFSRTFQPNGNAGTDHGWGSHALILGGAVNGGALYGTYPHLALGGPDDSGTRGTWVPSTSEDQYMGALAKWFGLAQGDMDYVFPNLTNFGFYQTPAFISERRVRNRPGGAGGRRDSHRNRRFLVPNRFCAKPKGGKHFATRQDR